MENKRPFAKRIKNNLIYFSLVLLIFLTKIMPRPFALAIARGLAGLAYFFAAGERRKIHENLELAFGNQFNRREREKIGKECFRNIAQNLVDAILLPRLIEKKPDQIMPMQGFDNIRHALEKEKGIIFLTAHMGCFEMLSYRMSLLKIPVIVLGAKIYDPRLNEIIRKNRQRFNVSYVERGTSLKEIYRVLHQGGGFGVLCDLDTRVESGFINFFGHSAKTPSGPFKLGIKRGIPLVPVFALRAPEGHQTVIIYPEIIPEANAENDRIMEVMKSYNAILENLISKDPAQWIWMHERWKSKAKPF